MLKVNLNEVNSMVIDSERLDSDDNIATLIGQQLLFLTKMGYECRFCYEDCGVYNIAYAYPKWFGYGNPYLTFVEEVDDEEIGDE